MARKNRWAAIDVGSNAIRMMVADYTPLGFQVRKKFRIAIRLGSDVFAQQRISGKNLKAAARAFRRFSVLTKKMGASRVRAVATSAVREAKNGSAFVELMHRKSNIRVEIIDGLEEGKLIFTAVAHEVHLENHGCLLLDIGGGSVELSICEEGKLIATKSFPFGTVRTLSALKKRNLDENSVQTLIGEYLKPMTDFLSSHAGKRPTELAIGTGGNIEALGKLRSQLLGKSAKTQITLTELEELIARLRALTVKERIEKIGLRADRADVIVPAALLVEAVLRHLGVPRLLIPFVGVRDGILWSLARAD